MTSTTKPDYWSILGILPGSDLKEIKSAFRSEARRWHPDLNVNDSNAEERFKLINEAYAVLSDPVKRSTWELSYSSQNQNFDLFATGFPTYSEYLDVVLGVSADRNQYQDVSKNNDQNVSTNEDISISNSEDYYEEEDSFNDYIPTKTSPQPPPIKHIDDMETVVYLSPDEALNGTIVEIELMNGTTVEFSTPPFSGDGWRLRLPGVVVGGGDHFIQIRAETDQGLRIDGLRVLYRLELFPHDALFGCGVEVPTLDGPVLLQVPPKSSSGRLLRLKGRGLKYNDIYGDQIVEIILVLPEDLTDSELALYKRLQDISLSDNI